MKKKLLIAVGGAVIVILIGMFLAVTNGLKEGADATLRGIDLSDIPDGSYTGAYDFKRWSNTVVVHIKDRRIIGIDIEKDVFGAEITNCSAEIISRVIGAQDTKVDAVSRATVTSKAYLKAIEDALSP